MCKHLYLLLLAVSAVFGQPPEVILVKTEQRTFKGSVAKYPITMTLTVDTFSTQHDSVYSVKGWYWYDRKEIKIPLVGVFDGGLTLYSFSNANDEKEILAVGNDWDGTVWDRLDQLKMKESFEFDEHFSFNDDLESSQKGEFSGTWQNADSQLEATLVGKKLDVFSQDEYLVFPDDSITPINLRNLGIYVTDFKFESWRQEKNEVRVLLSYAYHSNANHMGMCGGRYENGFVILYLTPDFRFVSFDKTPVESCRDSLYAELNSKNSDIYTLTDGDRKKTRLRIDRKNVKIIKL